jgi:hypothetical protein
MKNTQFKVQVTPEQSTAIQRAIFEKRGQWADGTTNVKHLGKPFLIVRHGMITCTDSESMFLNLDTEEIPQWFAHEALKLIKTRTSINPTYIVDVRGSTVAIREKCSPGTNTPVWPQNLDRDTPGLVYLWELGNTTRYCKKSNSVVSYTNEYRYSVMKQAHKLCDELNKENNEKEHNNADTRIQTQN